MTMENTNTEIKKELEPIEEAEGVEIVKEIFRMKLGISELKKEKYSYLDSKIKIDFGSPETEEAFKKMLSSKEKDRTKTK